jgi:hypothetical protein
MSVPSHLVKLFRGGGRRKQAPVRKSMRPRLALEALEDRQLLSASTLFQQINLVSDQPGVALNLDPTLVNAWGISAAPTAGVFWVSANGTGLSELYLGDVNGSAIQQPFKVTIPGGRPTGGRCSTSTSRSWGGERQRLTDSLPPGRPCRAGARTTLSAHRRGRDAPGREGEAGGRGGACSRLVLPEEAALVSSSRRTRVGRGSWLTVPYRATQKHVTSCKYVPVESVP